MATPLPPQDFLIVADDDYPVIVIPDRLTVLEAVAFKHTCHQLLDQDSPPAKIILDFTETQFIDSSGIGALVHNLKAAASKKVELLLNNVNPPVMGVLCLTGLDSLLTIENTLISSKSQLPSNSDLCLPQTHPSVSCSVKRLMDIVGSIVGLAITGVLFIPIAIAIKWDSPGPIFF